MPCTEITSEINVMKSYQCDDIWSDVLYSSSVFLNVFKDGAPYYSCIFAKVMTMGKRHILARVIGT